MPRSTQNLVITLETLNWVPDPLRTQKDGFGFYPGVWPVFFKIDGSTALVSDSPDTFGNLLGTATVSGTSGTGKTSTFFELNSSVPIPQTMDQWATQIEPIPLGPNLNIGTDVAGIFGVAVIVFDPSGLEDDALLAGHAALNDGVLSALNDLIAGLPPFPQGISQAQIDALVAAVEQSVESAIEGSLDSWDQIYEEFFDSTWFKSVLVHYDQDNIPIYDLDQIEFSPAFAAGTVGVIGVNGTISQSRRSVGQGVLSHFASPVRAVAGYADDSYQHAIVATQDGQVTEIWWQGSSGVGRGTLSNFASSIVALAAFYSPDGYQHVIVATQDGVVTELWWQGSGGVGRGELTSFSSPIIGLAGYYSGDGYHNVIVATRDGNLSQLWWQGGGTVGRGVLTSLGSRVVDLAGYYAADALHHVIVASEDGDINELTWQGSTAAVQNLLAQVEAQPWNRVIGVGAYYAPSDYEQHVIVAMSNGELREFFWNPGDGRGVLHDDLANVPAMRPIIDAFVDASGYQHAIVATADNDVRELWWRDARPRRHHLPFPTHHPVAL
jgi:hypothetical protein